MSKRLPYCSVLLAAFNHFKTLKTEKDFILILEFLVEFLCCFRKPSLDLKMVSPLIHVANSDIINI